MRKKTLLKMIQGLEDRVADLEQRTPHLMPFDEYTVTPGGSCTCGNDSTLPCLIHGPRWETTGSNTAFLQ